MGPSSRDVVRIKSRAEWGARPALQTFPMKAPAKVVVVFSDTGTYFCQTKRECIKSMQEIQNHQMDVVGYPDVKHNFFIGMDGRAYEGTGWTNHGVKIRGQPKLDGKVLSICHIGGFQDYRPFYGMRETEAKLIKFGVDNNYIRKDYRRAQWMYEQSFMRYDEDWFRDM